MDVLRRMSLLDWKAPSRKNDGGSLMGRNNSMPSSRKKMSFRSRSGSINPTSFIHGGSHATSLTPELDHHKVRERAFSDAKNLSKFNRATGTLECPSPRSQTFSSGSSMPTKTNQTNTSQRTLTVGGRSSLKLNRDFLTSPWGSTESFLEEEDTAIPKEEITCLMPTGIIFEINVHPDNVILNIKKLVIETAMNNEAVPLRGCINPDSEKYNISYVTHQGKRQDILDETKTLRQLKPFKNVLKFSLKSKNKELYLFKKHIGKLISKDLKEYDDMRNCEVNDFRWKIKAFANNLAQKRKTRLESSWQERLSYQYPQRFVKFDPEHLKYLLPGNGPCQQFESPSGSNAPKFTIKVVSDACNVAKQIVVDIHITAETLLQSVCDIFEDDDYNPKDSCFQTIGEDSYIFGSQKLVEFAFIHEHISSNSIPSLLLVRVNSVEVEEVGDSVYVMLDKDMELCANPAEKQLSRSSTTISESSPVNVDLFRPSISNVVHAAEVHHPFSVYVEYVNLTPYLSGSQVPISPGSIGIQLGLFHGAKRLCSTLTQFLKPPSTNSGWIFSVQKPFEFDISLSRLPRMTKLCIGIFEKKPGWTNSTQPIFWVNAHIFDYRGVLLTRDTLHMWRYTGEVMPTHETNLSPLRHTVSNPDTVDTSNLILQLFSLDNTSTPITNETDPKIRQRAVSACAIDRSTLTPIRIEFNEASSTGGSTLDLIEDGIATSMNTMSVSGSLDKTKSSEFNVISKLYNQELKVIANRDPLHDITEQEKDLIWKVRHFCCTFLPRLLPRIIDCVDYSNPQQVQQLHYILAKWPPLPVECAFQLLDYAYPDTFVRAFAVKCLRKHATDNDVLLYMLQLCQALKHEAYLMSDLVEFLLERALNNQHIGHFLFWELRADMNKSTSAASLLYGLLLEAYLVAAPEHEIILEHQLILLEKCKATSLDIQKLEIVTRSHQKAKHRFAAALKNQFYGYHPYRNFVNPLNPNQKCKRILLDKCKLMNSKMRPQLLCFENAATLNNKRSSFNISGRATAMSSSHDTNWIEMETPNATNDIHIMFKKGDDLRQDKLTLQLLAVIDRVWKESGLDLRMTLYKCVATDVNEGLIEVVQKAETLCKIQMRTGITPTSATFKKGLLKEWLKQHNPTVAEGCKAQEQFTLSCAGYSVAAYVLGIGDRHNDNVMVKTNGQMFHIDFGHFLGNFKYKFGIRRERVPILLSSEFIDVIKTDEFGRQRNFENFRNHCERAYLSLRRNGSLLISLLAMMISTGLPELSSEQDLNIVRSTLNLDRSEEEALENFKREFDESLRNAWKISLDWWFHMMNQTRSNRAT